MTYPVLLDREHLLRAIESLDRRLTALGHHPQTVIVVGGSYLALVELRDSTRDVDVATRLSPTTRRAIQHVAIEHGLPPRWMNDDAAVFLPAGVTTTHCTNVFEGTALTVAAPSADWIFLMKLYAARAVDQPDLVRLWPHTGFASPAEAVARYWSAYPYALPDDDLPTHIAQIAARAS